MRKRKGEAATIGAAAVCAWFAIASATADAQDRSAPRAAPPSPNESEVLALDQRIADAIVRGDTSFVDSVTTPDFVMVHGDGWTHGGRPLLTDTEETMLRRVAQKYYDVLDFDSVKAEMHGDVAITYGRYVAHTARGDDPSTRWFSVWFERVYARRDGRWIYLSHRTVHGPTFGPDRESLRGK